MSLKHNPYTPMLLTFDPARFVGRENEVYSILQVLTAKEPTGHAIYGIRLNGKTALLKFLMAPDGAQKRYAESIDPRYTVSGDRRLLFVYVSFHLYKRGDGIFWKILTALIDQLEDDPAVADVFIPEYENDINRMDAVHVVLDLVGQLDDLGIRVVFLLDDFDDPLRYIDDDDDHLLRTISDQAPLVIATDAPISELRPDFNDTSPLLGILRPEPIGLLDEREARQIITLPVEDVLTPYSEVEIGMLLRVAGRQPFCLITACELYFDMIGEYAEVRDVVNSGSLTEVEHLEERFLQQLLSLPHVYSALKRLWMHLTRDERTAVISVAAGREAEDRVTTSFVLGRLATKGIIYPDYRAGGYRMFGRVFARYVQQVTVEVPVVRESQFPEIRNLLDRMTPLDRSVYQYLATRKGQVCAFDEVLNAVWSDGEGSKRALEASVHRLRRILEGIEEVKNVRGKGYILVTSE